MGKLGVSVWAVNWLKRLESHSSLALLRIDNGSR